MRKLLPALVWLMGVVFCAGTALAEEIKTDFFTLTLADGWVQPQPVQSVNGATMVMVQNTTSGTVVTVTVTPAPLPAKDLASQTTANMTSAGFTVSEVRAAGDSCVAEFSQGQARGVSYFSSNGQKGSVVTIMGISTDSGREMLQKHFKAKDAALFPAAF